MFYLKVIMSYGDVGVCLSSSVWVTLLIITSLKVQFLYFYITRCYGECSSGS